MLKRGKGISLRTTYIWIIIAALIISGLMVYSTFRLTTTFERLTEATENQIELEKAAHRLMDASDYLTEQVQRFTIAGDVQFMENYFREAFETKRREEAIEKMSVVQNASAAQAELTKALDESRELMNREYRAMRLVAEAKGYTDLPEEVQRVSLTAGEAGLTPEEKMRRATEIVLDDAYFDQKDRIRTDMQRSLDTLEALTHDAEAEALNNLRKSLNVIRADIALQIVGIIFLVWLTVHLGINPIMRAVGNIKADRPIEENGANEFRYLAKAYNGLTDQLNEENELLKEASQTDALTGIRNRLALRNDYDSYHGHEVTVMLLDMDLFKTINDTRGHEEGDRVLSETGKLLADTFGKKHCYRYGGDEFLVVAPDLSEAEFLLKLNTVMDHRPVLDQDGQKIRVGYSVGYVHAFLDENRDLRDLFAEADQKMYQIKRDKIRTDTITGGRNRNHYREAGVQAAEYTPVEMKQLLDRVSGMYDLARVVDPIECRILEFGEDGRISRKERCYGIWNADQKCVNCSSAMACRTGCHQEKAESFNNQLYHIQSNPVRLKLDDGGTYDAVVELVSIDREGAETAHAANDRAAENKNHRAARYHAQHDNLTKVLNSGAFSELSREVIVKHPATSWTMVTSNIMDFRLVNTLFGAQKGNEAIIRNAAALQRIAVASGGLCGRLGGDQFALLLPREQYQEEKLLQAARDLREAFSSGLYTFCVHFGVYDVEDISIPVSVMCDRANTALRTIRDNPRETVVRFNHDMMQKSLFEQEIISGFENALKAGQLAMYLQPIVSDDGKAIGAEALARWKRPDGTVIRPDQFIETLEHAGMIHQLDQYIWECAVRQLSRWKGTERERLFISINMSAKDFYSMDVYPMLTDLMDRYQVPTSRLRIEITETALLEDPENVNEVISLLRRRGFLVEIDDFGKGFSSLTMLKDIHADVLKIDMSLLRDVEEKPRSRTIVESIIHMSDSLGMGVIAEGVETETQLQLLTAMGCHHFQGYYFSRPVPAEEFEAGI